MCPECFFSISHTDGLVAVAVSMKNIGVDIEKRDIACFEKLDIDMMLHESEKSAFSSLDASKRAEKACKLWTLKEASYKHGGVGAFEPSTIDTNKKPSAVRKVRSNGNDYIIGIVGDDFLKVRVNAFDGIEISDKH